LGLAGGLQAALASALLTLAQHLRRGLLHLQPNGQLQQRGALLLVQESFLKGHTHTHTHTHAHRHTHTHTHTHAHTTTDAQTCAQTHTHTHAHTCTQTHTHTHAHT